jgi:hypothetical protein
MERRHLEQEEALARARAVAGLEAHRGTEKPAAEPEPFAVEDQVEKPLIPFPQRRRSLRSRLDEFTSRVYERVREWRELSPNSEFVNTREYAWRQAVPAAAGLAIAFVLGWAMALASSGNEKTLRASPAPVATIPPTAAQTAAAGTPVAQPVRAKRAKPSPLVRKSNAKVSRRHSRKIEPQEADVVIVRHPPHRQLIARANQKNGVKTISDME